MPYSFTAFWGTDTVLGVELLWQVLGLAFLCSVGCIKFFKDSETATKKGMMCRFILSYLFVSAVFIGGGFLIKEAMRMNEKLKNGIKDSVATIALQSLLHTTTHWYARNFLYN